jgi:Lysine methyltransferase
MAQEIDPFDVVLASRHEHEEEEETEDAAELLMKRGDLLRMLREMEVQDNLERQREQDDSLREVEQSAGYYVGSPAVLDYNAWLRSDQRYHDDLKHIDYKYIDFRSDHWDPDDLRPLIVEQDKSLGKGGFCWDAAYILGEYLSSQSLDRPAQGASVVELGSGTGLCTSPCHERVVINGVPSCDCLILFLLPSQAE